MNGDSAAEVGKGVGIHSVTAVARAEGVLDERGVVDVRRARDARRAAPNSWREVVDAYQTLLPVPAGLQEAAQTFDLSRKLQMMGYVCNALTLRRGLEPIEEFNIKGQVDEVREMLRQIRHEGD